MVDNVFNFNFGSNQVFANGSGFFFALSDSDDFEPTYFQIIGAHTDEFPAAQNGETLTDYFNRVGNTFTTDSNQQTIGSSTVFESGGSITTTFLLNTGRVVTVDPVPEPSSIYMLLMAIGVFAGLRYRQSKKLQSTL